MTDNIQALIRRLDHDDVGEQRRAGTALLAVGAASVPALIDALATGSSRARRSAAFLLGSFKRSEEALAGLTRALADVWGHLSIFRHV